MHRISENRSKITENRVINRQRIYYRGRGWEIKSPLWYRPFHIIKRYNPQEYSECVEAIIKKEIFLLALMPMSGHQEYREIPGLARAR